MEKDVHTVIAKNGERFELAPLSAVGFSKVADAFLAAFEDYGLVLDRDKLRAMFTRRGADLNLSAGAFRGDDVPVSFIVNGIGTFGGVRTAYDTGTGTVKSCRGLGLTDSIFPAWEDVLRRSGVKQYLLEVLTDNVPAVKIYTRQGFAVSRDFNCYAFNGDSPEAADVTELKIVQASPQQIAGLQGFNDFEPSWQNSIESVERAADNVTCLVAELGGRAVGFGVTEAAYGDIAQIAVDPAFRRRGIGSGLLAAMIRLNKSGETRVVNVETRCVSLNEFLIAKGFTLICTQHEMIKAL